METMKAGQNTQRICTVHTITQISLSIGRKFTHHTPKREVFESRERALYRRGPHCQGTARRQMLSRS